MRSTTWCPEITTDESLCSPNYSIVESNNDERPTLCTFKSVRVSTIWLLAKMGNINTISKASVTYGKQYLCVYKYNGYLD